MSALAYELRGVSKVYEGQPVLHVDRLEITRGKIFALVGPSGAAKSTLLRLLNFLEPPTSGTLSFMGMEIASRGTVPLEVRRRVTTVFQRPILLNRTVSSNVRFGLRLRGQRDAKDLVGPALGQVGLSDIARRNARTLSGGEAQRVALARALVLRPDVLLLDEPTANLDPYNVGLIEEIVRDDSLSRGTTVVWVTHNVFQARRVAHKVGLLLDGQIVEVAEAERFFESPRDPRTAAFVRGEMVY
jgi:tungstate transport system ATP-binding protein